MFSLIHTSCLSPLLHPNLLSCCPAPGSCGLSWSSAAAWAPPRWTCASWGQSSGARWRGEDHLKGPCRTCRPHLARCRWVSAAADRTRRRTSKVTHTSRSYSIDSLQQKTKTQKEKRHQHALLLIPGNLHPKCSEDWDDNRTGGAKNTRQCAVLTTRWKHRAKSGSLLQSCAENVSVCLK